MVHELASADREELKDKQLLSLRAHGTAQLPSKRIRNEQDRRKQVCYSMQHHEEQSKFLAWTWSTQYDQEQDCRGGGSSFCFGCKTCVSPGSNPGAGGIRILSSE
jgi:hypothetical protein